MNTADQDNLPRYQPGRPFTDEVTASRLNRTNAKVDGLARSMGPAMRGAGGGMYASLAMQAGAIGLITDTGPEGDEDDFTDNRYWVRLANPSKTYTDEASGEIIEATNGARIQWEAREEGESQTIIATNIGEADDSHALAIDETQVVVIRRVGREPNAHYIFSHTVGGAEIVFKISANATGGGQYTAKSFDTGTGSEVSSTSNASESKVGALSGTIDLLAINLREIGESTHDLSADEIHIGVLTGDVDEADRRVVVFDPGGDDGGGGVDLKNNGTTVVTNAASINFPTTRNTNGILEFFDAGSDQGNLRFVSAGSTYQVLQKNSGGNVVWDYVRAHA